MGGPVYHFDPALQSNTKLPAYYDKALFMYDWMRNWVFAVRMDEQQNFVGMERFMPEQGDFRRPADMEVGPEGSIYMLEYGSVYGIDNEDARLVRIDFNPGNRAPVAKVTAKDTIGLAPLNVAFGNDSYDYDKTDQLRYQWRFEGNTVASTEAKPTYTFRKNGIYKAQLTVTDPSGKTSSDTLTIRVGNTLPQVAISTSDNSTFFLPNQAPLRYAVVVADKEDKVIDTKRVNVAMTYIPKVAGNEQQMGHQQLSASFNLGKSLIAGSDCKACHQIDAKSVGPSFMEISKKYRDDKTATAKLANKIIIGGGGVWGEHAMSAHPQLSREETTEMVKYIFSLGMKPADNHLPQQGSVVLKDHVGNDQSSRYILTASYTDKGSVGGKQPSLSLTQRDALILRPTKVLATEVDELHEMAKQGRRLSGINDQSWFMLKGIDLKGIDQLTYHYASKDQEATIEVHTDSPTGPVISKVNTTPTGDGRKYADITAPLQTPVGKHDLYFVFTKPGGKNLLGLEWVTFGLAKDGGSVMGSKGTGK